MKNQLKKETTEFEKATENIRVIHNLRRLIKEHAENMRIFELNKAKIEKTKIDY